MLSSHYTEALLGIKDAIITNIEERPKEATINVWITLKREIHECPRCHELTDRIHDYRNHWVKGPPLGERFLLFHYRKRRYVCPCCGKRFDESNSFVPRYHRMSSALISFILKELKSTSSIVSIARRCNVSFFTVSRIFDFISPSSVKLPEVLSIDEFKGNTDAGKYQCILTDPQKHRTLDILPGRESHHLTSYFASFPRKERDRVKVVVMDMWKPYQDIAQTYFKNAIMVIDRFHYIRHVFWAFDKIRRDEQQLFSRERRRYFKRSKKLLWARFNNLSEDNRQAVEVMLSLSHRLRTAFLLKEKFLEFVDASSLDEAKLKLNAWYLFVASCKLPEFDYCFHTISRWQDGILNSFRSPYSNGFTEGVNNKIKVLKRNAFGVRKFSRFRTRILYMMSA
jgi:transposase